MLTAKEDRELEVNEFIAKLEEFVAAKVRSVIKPSVWSTYHDKYIEDRLDAAKDNVRKFLMDGLL